MLQCFTCTHTYNQIVRYYRTDGYTQFWCKYWCSWSTPSFSSLRRPTSGGWALVAADAACGQFPKRRRSVAEGGGQGMWFGYCWEVVSTLSGARLDGWSLGVILIGDVSSQKSLQKASKARKCHAYHCVWSLEFHFVMPWLMMTIAVNDPPEVDPERESEAETLAAGKIGVDQELCLRLLSCSLQSGVLAWAQERWGGDCTNGSKSGSSRRSELLSMCNLLKLAMSPHLSLNPRQYITGRGVDQESSTGHLGPMCFGTVDDWWWLCSKGFKSHGWRKAQESHKYIRRNLGEVTPETVLVEAGAKTSEITMRIMKDMGALSVFCRTSLEQNCFIIINYLACL